MKRKQQKKRNHPNKGRRRPRRQNRCVCVCVWGTWAEGLRLGGPWAGGRTWAVTWDALTPQSRGWQTSVKDLLVYTLDLQTTYSL